MSTSRGAGGTGTPLHLACCRGGRRCAAAAAPARSRCPPEGTATGTRRYIAPCTRALKHGGTALQELVVPLRLSCPHAVEAANGAGVTPGELLRRMSGPQTAANTSRPSDRDRDPERDQDPERDLDPEREWLDKLFGECEDEFCETFGVYDDFLPLEEDEEAFGDWADRIRKEYFDKKHAEAQRLARGGRGGQQEEQRQRSDRDLRERLRREHEEYLSRAARKDEETRQGRKRRYEERAAATFHGGSSAGGAALSYGDIPWPAPRGSVQQMVEVMLHGVDRKDAQVFRKALRKQQALWHPDKFAQRCEARLEPKDRRRILDTVTELSQELNRLAQGLRA